MTDPREAHPDDPDRKPESAQPAVPGSGDDNPAQPQPIEPEPPVPEAHAEPSAPAAQSPADFTVSAPVPDPEPPTDRSAWGARLRSGWALLVYVIALVASVVTIVAYVEIKLDDSAIDTSRMRAQLLASVDDTYDAQKAAAEAITGDWQVRERRLEAAKAQRDAQLARIDDLAEEFQRIATGPDAESIAKSLARILQEQGPSAALDYIETKRGGIVARIRKRRAANRDRDREELGPLLASAGLYAAEAEAQPARALYTEVLALAPDWPEALEAHWRFLIDQGDLAVIRGTLDPAERDFALAGQRVDALIALEPEEPRWQRDLSVSLERLGDLKVTRGDLDGAQQDFERSLAIAERLAADEPGNAGWQRDLSVSLNKLGDLKVTRGDLDGAQQDFERSLAIRERLAADEPGNAGWQRDLAVSHFQLGRVADARDDEPALVQHWGATLALFDALDRAGLHITPSDRAGLLAIRARVEAAAAAPSGPDVPAAAAGGD